MQSGHPLVHVGVHFTVQHGLITVGIVHVAPLIGSQHCLAPCCLDRDLRVKWALLQHICLLHQLPLGLDLGLGPLHGLTGLRRRSVGRGGRALGPRGRGLGATFQQTPFLLPVLFLCNLVLQLLMPDLGPVQGHEVCHLLQNLDGGGHGLDPVAVGWHPLMHRALIVGVWVLCPAGGGLCPLHTQRPWVLAGPSPPPTGCGVGLLTAW
mmetsp:Transcript_24605/g.44626  ORF Transcript_24605/g.44626 Transcript_24605/m.44626 type:complete len:208 (-) Transcript_24605:569-1192(-)